MVCHAGPKINVRVVKDYYWERNHVYGSDWTNQETLEWRMGVWVNAADVARIDTDAFPADIRFPNKDHDIGYLCLGVEPTSQVDKRCLSTDVTVIFASRFTTRTKKHGSQYLLLITGTNLLDKERDRKCRICNTKCMWRRFAIWWLPFIVGIPLLIVVVYYITVCLKHCSCHCCCKPRSAVNNGQPDQDYPGSNKNGKSFQTYLRTLNT